MKISLLIFSALFAVCLPLGYKVLFPEGDAWAFFLISVLCALTVNVSAMIMVRKLLPQLFYQYFYFIMLIIALTWFTVYHLLAENTRNPYGGYYLQYDHSSLQFFVAWLMPALATCLLFPILYFINRSVTFSSPRQRVETDRMRKTVVWIFFLFNVLYLFTNLNIEIPVLSYFGRVGYNSSIFFLFWVTYWNKRLGLLFYLTVALMITIAVFEALVGSRYAPIMIFLLMFLGFYFGGSRKVKTRLALVAIIVLPFMITAVGYLEKIRVLIGRGGLEDVSVERIEMVQKAVKKLDKVDSSLRDNNSAFIAGVARNINWVDVAVITATKTRVPYRGTNNIGTEVRNILSLAFLSGGASKEEIIKARLNRFKIGLGTSPAREYGFVVDDNTSVEWSILADAFSRGGHFIYLFYLLLFYFIFANIELVIRVFNRNSVEQKLLLCVFLEVVIKANSLPMYESIRGIILYSLFYGAIIFGIRMISLFRMK